MIQGFDQICRHGCFVYAAGNQALHLLAQNAVICLEYDFPFFTLLCSKRAVDNLP